jgi:hypothetical protein
MLKAENGEWRDVCHDFSAFSIRIQPFAQRPPAFWAPDDKEGTLAGMAAMPISTME